MADDKFILNVDDDWKRQAQAEKKRLAEQEQKEKAVAPPPAVMTGPAGDVTREQLEEVDSPFSSLVQSLLTQALVYLGGMPTRSGQPMLNLDAARKAVDMMGVLDDKTRNNLTDLERKLLDTALYEARNRFVSVASQYIGP